MKIGVCIKYVPAPDVPLRFDANATWVRAPDTTFEVNEADGFALEEAVRIKEQHGGEVVLVTLGPERAVKALREGLAKGADRGILIADEAYHRLEPLQTAAFMAALLRDEQFDLLLTGLQSDDLGFAQTGVILAELLGLPHASIVVAVALSGDRLCAKRELESGWFQWVELPLPCVLTIQSGINKPRYAGMKGMMAAKKKEIRQVERTGMLLNVPSQTIRTERFFVPTRAKQAEMLQGDAGSVARELLQKLRLSSEGLSG